MPSHEVSHADDVRECLTCRTLVRQILVRHNIEVTEETLDRLLSRFASRFASRWAEEDKGFRPLDDEVPCDECGRPIQVKQPDLSENGHICGRCAIKMSLGCQHIWGFDGAVVKCGLCGEIRENLEDVRD